MGSKHRTCDSLPSGVFLALADFTVVCHRVAGGRDSAHCAYAGPRAVYTARNARCELLDNCAYPLSRGPTVVSIPRMIERGRRFTASAKGVDQRA
jgi:hypothetical protein